MNPRLLTALCIMGLLAAFAIDLATPQLFIAAILLDIPIVLSAFLGSRRLTGSLAVGALTANVIAGYVNGLQAGGTWNTIAIADRFLEALSIILVGWLGLALHRRAEQQGIAAAVAGTVYRERALRESSERIRSTLSEELVERAIAREARKLLDAAMARFYSAGGAAGCTVHFEARRKQFDVFESRDRPSASIESVLVAASETGEIGTFTQSDAMGRLLLGELQAVAAIVAPIEQHGNVAGSLLIVLDREPSQQDMQLVPAFVDAAANALSQAKLFVELARKNDELAQRSRVIRDIVYALSHDLRTPLAAAGLTLRQARTGAFGSMPPKYLDVLDRSIEANDEVQRLAETLLLVAQYESGEHAAAYRPLDLTRLVQDVVAQMQSLADSKHITVEMRMQEATVNGDVGEIRRALVNLFANAVKWSEDGGKIVVGVGVQDRTVRAYVSDEGFGVPESLREALFMRFTGERARGGGSGLGLYIVRRIAEAHGGRARYEPNEPRGSIFSIELPSLTSAVPVRA